MTTVSARIEPLRRRDRPAAARALERRDGRAPDDRGAAAPARRRRALASRSSGRHGRPSAGTRPRALPPGRRAGRARAAARARRSRPGCPGAQRRRGALLELVEPVRRRREADAAAPVEVDALPGLLLERPVEVEAGAQELHEVVARDELRAEARRMPGGAARKLGGLEQYDVRASEPRQVVGEAAAGDPPADDDDLRLSRESDSPRTRARA